MPEDKNDTNQPILILVRRGRGGRGYLVSPVDNPTDVAACSSANEVGDAALELLDDPNQPRVNIEEILAMASGEPIEEGEDDEDRDSTEDSRAADDEQDEEEEDGDDGEGEEGEEEDGEDRAWWDVRGAEDPADQILVNVLGGVLGKAQKVSNRQKRRRRHHRGSSRKKRR